MRAISIERGSIPPSRKGIKMSKAQKLKISMALKGKKTHEWTEESKKKIGDAFRGRVLSLEHRKKMSIAQQKRVLEGRHHNYKGGITPENKRIRQSMKYRVWRESVFSRDKYTCQDCGAKSGQGKHIELHPHHIKSFAYYPKLRFWVTNGKTLCVPCHEKTENYKCKANKQIYGKLHKRKRGDGTEFLTTN